MATNLITYIIIFLGIFCATLFFEGVYSALTKKERRGWLGIIIQTLLIVGILILLDKAGIMKIAIACW